MWWTKDRNSDRIFVYEANSFNVLPILPTAGTYMYKYINNLLISWDSLLLKKTLCKTEHPDFTTP